MKYLVKVVLSKVFLDFDRISLKMNVVFWNKNHSTLGNFWKIYLFWKIFGIKATLQFIDGRTDCLTLVTKVIHTLNLPKKPSDFVLSLYIIENTKRKQRSRILGEDISNRMIIISVYIQTSNLVYYAQMPEAVKQL